MTPAPIDMAGAMHGWQVALPAITALCAAFVVMLTDLAMRGTERDGVAVVGVLGLGATIAVAIGLWLSPVGSGGFHDTLRADPYALFFAVVICVGATFTVLMSIDYLRDHPLAGGDYYALVLLSTCGMILMAAANDLIVIFLALEIMSVAVYVLVGMLRQEVRSNEASLKYFLLGAFASGFLLYGIALLFGATGTTNLAKMAVFISDSNRFGQGSLRSRLLKLGLAKCGLWPLANLIKTRGTGYSISAGDGSSARIAARSWAAIAARARVARRTAVAIAASSSASVR